MANFISKLNFEYGRIENYFTNINTQKRTIKVELLQPITVSQNGEYYFIDISNFSAFDQYLLKTFIPLSSKSGWATYKDSYDIMRTDLVVFGSWDDDSAGKQYIAVKEAVSDQPDRTFYSLELEYRKQSDFAFVLARDNIVGTSVETLVVAELSPSNHYSYNDILIEQGLVYQYRLFNKSDINDIITQLATPIAIGEQIQSDFEDIFLSDSEHSLRIRFNPKVSSFKTIIQEQKIETIGGQFPFFVRNGNIKYKSFPINGLLSYKMDDWFNFSARPGLIDEDRIQTPMPESVESPPASLENFYIERKFKMEVYDWLTNGSAKIFRSAQEGNYIIRLMEVSLTPEEKLSRLVHSFSATAYEMGEYSIENLKKLNLIPIYAETIESNVIATNERYGLVKGSTAAEKVSVTEDGTMSVNSLSITKLTQGEDEIIFTAED